MNLIPVEWSEAQAVLLKLVQTLTPWTGKEISPSFFLSKRFSFADRQEAPHIRSSVKLLTTLRAAREWVDEWVGEEKGRAPKAPQGEKGVPFAKQAERMIVEVQEAIGSMVYSTNLKQPNEEPLRAALKRLRPHLEELIEAATQGEMPSGEERSPLSRYTPPVSTREHLLRRVAQRGEKLGWEVEEQKSRDPVGAKSASPTPHLREERREALPMRGGERPQEKKEEPPPVEMRPRKIEGSEPVPAEKSERVILPAVPFVPPPKNPILSKKKGKKRQGFWYRDDEEEPERR